MVAILKPLENSTNEPRSTCGDLQLGGDPRRITVRRARPTRGWGRFCCLAWLLAFSLAAGCKPDSDSEATNEPRTPQISDVPLRVWAVTEVANPEVLRRKWLATSSQPVEFRSLTVDEFLASDRCACDVILFPMHLIGELQSRNWLSSLPVSLRADTSDSAVPTFPRAMMAQCEYDGKQIAIPLGLSVQAAVASSNFPAAESEEVLAWDAVLDMIKQVDGLSIDRNRVDLDAVADRFLAVLSAYSTRNSKYGKLFELKTVKPLVDSEEFVQAATTLKALALQTSDGVLACGSHSDALMHVLTSEDSALSLVAINALNETAAKAKGGAVLKELPKAAGLDNVGIRNWNTGGGLIAAIGADCSQSLQAAALLEWLAKDTTRNDIATQLAGVDVSAPVFGIESLSWKATQTLRRTLDANDLPQELRLPAAREYRHALAKELVAYFEGSKTVQAALGDATAAWEAITAKRKEQAAEYSSSLGLVY